MLVKQAKKLYKGFGFNIYSEINLPELVSIENLIDLPDIIIEIGDLKGLWSELGDHPYGFVVKENFVMFQLPNVAIFSIQDGIRIQVSPLSKANEDQIRLYVLGTCMGALLMQRRVLPLHGSAIAIDGKAYAIVGESGAGKSTLASTFLEKGYKLLSDDVIAVTIAGDGIPYVTSSYPQQKLWQESLEQFGVETRHFRPIYQRETKYAVPVTSKFFSGKLPLAGIFELVKVNGGKIQLSKVQNLHRLNTILRHTYRNGFITDLGLTEWHFNYSIKMINSIEVFRLERSNTSEFTAFDLSKKILNHIKHGGKILC